MPPSLFSRLKEFFFQKNPYTPREWAIFLLLIVIEIIIHEAAHVFAAKHFNCLKKIKFSLRGLLWTAPYLVAVETTQDETVRQSLIATAVGPLAGLAFGFFAWFISPLWHYLIWIGFFGSMSDMFFLRFWYSWGKDNGFDRPMWHGPRGYWRDKGHIVEIYEADDFPLYYDD